MLEKFENEVTTSINEQRLLDSKLDILALHVDFIMKKREESRKLTRRSREMSFKLCNFARTIQEFEVYEEYQDLSSFEGAHLVSIDKIQN